MIFDNDEHSRKELRKALLKTAYENKRGYTCSIIQKEKLPIEFHNISHKEILGECYYLETFKFIKWDIKETSITLIEKGLIVCEKYDGDIDKYKNSKHAKEILFLLSNGIIGGIIVAIISVILHCYSK